MSLFPDILWDLSMALAFLMLFLLPVLANVEKRERAQQFLMPFVALLYCIPLSLFTESIADWFANLLASLIGLLTLLPVIGPRLGQLLTDFMQSVFGHWPLAVLYNFAIMLVFVLIKPIAILITRKLLPRIQWLGNKIAGRFYRQWRTKSILYQRFGDMRRLLKALYIAVLILGCLNGALIFHNARAPLFDVPSYPVFAVIVVGEVFFFLSGKTVDEIGSSDGDDSQDQEVECGSVLDALKLAFGDRLGYSDHRLGRLQAGAESNVDWEQLLEDGDDLDRVTLSYARSIRSAGQEVDPDYVIAANKLLHGQSVLINNPFYQDMSDTIMLPLYHALLNHKNCLIICGRSNSEQDVQAWIRDCMVRTTHLPKLWNVSILDKMSEEQKSSRIGILGFRRIFDLENLRENQAFFRNTSLVLMLEPSNLLGTGQIGLRSALQSCEAGGNPLVYCILDRNADGLVDALSHVTHQSITEVVASPSAHSNYCRAFWRAEGPGMHNRILEGISHYLGVGGELAAVAAHEGAGAVHWYSGGKMALTDLKWNVEQYYAPICRFLGMPEDQVELDATFHYHGNLWQADFGPGSFVLVEDEFCNAFEMERAFGSRIRVKGFVNVLSEAYMLRDYMYYYSDLFTNDPKAIPSIVPDYARTERNFVLRTLMMMAVQPMEESALSEQLSLHGIETSRAYPTLKMLVRKHTDLTNPHIHTSQSEHGRIGVAGFTRYSFSIDQADVNRVFDSALRVAFFVIENEKTQTYLMGNRLMDHVEQILLPGQFFCYDGRYYQVRSISRDNGIVVRRASDHLNGRWYYRQIRHYSVEPVEDKVQVVRNGKDQLEDSVKENKDHRGIRIQSVSSDVEVRTPAYLEMMVRNDLPNANYVELDHPNVGVRRLYHKEMLRLQLPDASASVRFTLCVLLNELFQTVYPNDSCYISACMDDVPESALRHPDYEKRIASVVPILNLAGATEESIFIIEDSNIDLGLLVSCERNLQRFLEILADYLDWYMNPARLKKDSADSETTGEPQQNTSRAPGNSLTPGPTNLLTLRQSESDSDSHHDQDEIDAEEEQIRDSGAYVGTSHFEYLTFGYPEEADLEWLSLKETLDYLTERGFLESNLHRVHAEGDRFDKDSDFDPVAPGVHYCDFCGQPMETGNFDVLKDGRERCPQCSKDAIRTKQEFEQIYLETVKEMEQVFQIQFSNPVRVRMTNAKKVNEPFVEYKPSPGYDSRICGYARGNTVLVENGAPRWKMKQTLVHELTHVWQHENWQESFLSRYKQEEHVTNVMEGMAVWAEVQYLLSMGEKERAIRYKRNRDYDTSVYGVGMKLFIEKYPPKSKKTIQIAHSPFGKFPPI